METRARAGALTRSKRYVRRFASPQRPRIGHNGPVRRPLAGLLFGIAFACACVAISGFLLQRTALSPDRTASAATTVLEDEQLQKELVKQIGDATADAMYPGDATGAAIARQKIATVLALEPGAEILAPLLTDAHEVLIGASEDPVQLTPEALVPVVRDERASALPALAFDVPRLGVLAFVDGLLNWLVPVSALAALAFLVMCFFARPERAALLHSLGIGLVALAALSLVFAYILPKFVPPLLSDSVWAHMPSRMADDGLPLTLFAAVVFAAAGLGLFTASGRMGRSKRWSTPVSTYRYREERSWS
jgi:hypothetical protein